MRNKFLALVLTISTMFFLNIICFGVGVQDDNGPSYCYPVVINNTGDDLTNIYVHAWNDDEGNSFTIDSLKAGEIYDLSVQVDADKGNCYIGGAFKNVDTSASTTAWTIEVTDATTGKKWSRHQSGYNGSTSADMRVWVGPLNSDKAIAYPYGIADSTLTFTLEDDGMHCTFTAGSAEEHDFNVF